MKELADLINNLPEVYSTPFTLFYKGASYSEIADQLDISEEDARERVFYARKEIRQSVAAGYSCAA